MADLSGRRLGEATSTHVVIDVNAAGFGWYVDPTPHDQTDDVIGARMDLLTTVTHEIGHVLGYEDSYSQTDASDIMFGRLGVGERRSAGLADELDWEQDLLSQL